MSENVNFQTPESDYFMRREDWLVLLTGGLVSSSAIGWYVHRGFKYELNSKAIMTIAASFVGGMGVYFTGSALVCLCRKSHDNHGKSRTPRKDKSDIPALRSEINLCERFVDIVNEIDKKFASEAMKVRKSKGLDEKTFKNNIQEVAEVPYKSEDTTRRLRNFNRKGPKIGLKLPSENLMETHSNEGMGSLKTKFREEILSYINELKGYVQGTIDPLPLARNHQFRLTDMSDEMRRQVVMIVNEYANSIQPTLDQVIDEFVNSVCIAAGVLDCDKEYKMKKEFEVWGFSEKNLLTAPLKIEMNQYYNALKNATKNDAQIPFYQNDQRYKNNLGANMQPLESVSSSCLLQGNTCAKTSEPSLPVMPKLCVASPTPTGIPFMSKEEIKPDHLSDETLRKPSVKLILNKEQMECLNLLKSEL